MPLYQKPGRSTQSAVLAEAFFSYVVAIATFDRENGFVYNPARTYGVRNEDERAATVRAGVTPTLPAAAKAAFFNPDNRICRSLKIEERHKKNQALIR